MVAKITQETVTIRVVTPAKAGVQEVKPHFKRPFQVLDTGFRRYDCLS